TGLPRHLVSFQPMPGMVDTPHEIYVVRGAEYIGEPTDAEEAGRVEWIPLRDIPELVRRGEVAGSGSLVGLRPGYHVGAAEVRRTASIAETGTVAGCSRGIGARRPDLATGIRCHRSHGRCCRGDRVGQRHGGVVEVRAVIHHAGGASARGS